MEALNQLVEQLLNSEYGKALSKTDINLSAVTDRITEITNELDGYDPFAEKEEGSKKSTREERRKARKDKRDDRRQTRSDNLAARLEESDLDPEAKKTRLGKELQLLKQQLRDQIPRSHAFKVTGRIYNRTQGIPLSGVRVKLGFSTDLLTQQIPIPVGKETTLSEDKLILGEDELITQNFKLPSIKDLTYIPVPNSAYEALQYPSKPFGIFHVDGEKFKNKALREIEEVITDKNGHYSFYVVFPQGYIPATRKVLINFALLFSKVGFIPGTLPLLNGDRTIKDNQPAYSLIDIDKSAELLSEEYNNAIDNANEFIDSVALEAFQRIVKWRKKSLNNITSSIKRRLIPLCVSLLIAFGIDKLTNSNRKTCPTPEALNDVIRRRNKAVRQLNQIYQTIALNTGLSLAFFALANVLRGVRLGLTNLNIPQAFGTPPGPAGGLVFALPYSFTAKMQSLQDVLKELEDQNKELTKSLLISLVFLIAGTATVIILLNMVDKMTQECIEENGGDGLLELELINQELLDLTEEQEEDGNKVVTNLNGFTFSVETDNQNPVGTLKRRFAVAKNPQGVTLLKGEPSFSSNDQILIDELVFYIQQKDLKAY